MTMRVLAGVRTIRRVWAAAPFLGIALFGVPTLLSLIYEERFDLTAAERGLVAAGIEPLQIVGVLVAMPAVAHLSERDPGFLLRFVAAVGVVDAALLVVLAGAPDVAVAIAVHAVAAASIGTLAPAFLALVSLVAPPRVRSAASSTMSVFAIPRSRPGAASPGRALRLVRHASERARPRSRSGRRRTGARQRRSIRRRRHHRGPNRLGTPRGTRPRTRPVGGAAFTSVGS